jgi:hypothetical protein
MGCRTLTGIVLWLYLIDACAFSEPTVNRNLFYIRGITIYYSFPINQISYDFFENYRAYSKSNASEFKMRNFPGIIVDVAIPNTAVFSVGLEWIGLKLSDNFYRNIQISYTSGRRDYSENFSFNFFPIAYNLIFSPWKTDFKTYFRFQIGVSFDKVRWEEYIQSSIPDDPKIGLHIYEKQQLNPFTCISIGVLLPFDIQTDSAKFLDSFFFESKFAFSYRKFNIFDSLEQSEKIPTRVTILPFFIVFNLGLRFNVSSFFLN